MWGVCKGRENHESEMIVCAGGTPQQDKRGQQLGLTRERARAGRTGSAGRARAGKRLTSFFIDRLLSGDNHTLNS